MDTIRPYENASVAMESFRAAMCLRGLSREAEALRGAEVMSTESAHSALAAINSVNVEDATVKAAQEDARRVLTAVLAYQ